MAAASRVQSWSVGHGEGLFWRRFGRTMSVRRCWSQDGGRGFLPRGGWRQVAVVLPRVLTRSASSVGWRMVGWMSIAGPPSTGLIFCLGSEKK